MRSFDPPDGVGGGIGTPTPNHDAGNSIPIDPLVGAPSDRLTDRLTVCLIWETPIPLSGYCKSYCTTRPLLLFCALVCLEMFCRLHGLTNDLHDHNNLHHPEDKEGDNNHGKEPHDT